MNIKLLTSIVAVILILLMFFFISKASSENLRGIRKINREYVPCCQCPEGEVYFFDYLNNTPYCGKPTLGMNYNPNLNMSIYKGPVNNGFCEVRLYSRTVPCGDNSKSTQQYTQTSCTNQLNNDYSNSNGREPIVTFFPTAYSQVQNYKGAYRGPVIIKKINGKKHKINTKTICPLGYTYIPAANMCTSFHSPQCIIN